MIEVKEKRRMSKRKFDESIEKNGCPVRPKETILDMSVSKLAKAKTRLNLEPSLRKTVMIVNTIRKIEEEIENGKGTINVNDAMSIDHCARANTRPNPMEVHPFEETTDSTEVVPVRMSMRLERRREPCANSESNSERFNNRCRSFGVSVVKSEGREGTGVFDLTQTSYQRKNKFLNKCSYSKLPDLEAEINFAEIDISLYDFDATLWSDGGGIQIACGGDLEDNDNVYKTNTGLSTLFRRCSDDLKFNKTAENSFTDDLDQIMQVLVGI